MKISAWSNDNIRTLSYALRWLVKLSRDHIPAIWLVYRERLDPSIATCAKYWRASESFGGQWLGWWVSAFPIVQCKIFTQKNRDKIHMEKAQWNSHIWAMQKNGEYFIFRKGDSSHYCVVESRNTTLFQILDLTPLFYLSMLLLSNIASAYLIIFIYDAEMVLETKVSV